jgi:lipopolysaccharide biosynthesis glycosyltransferase
MKIAIAIKADEKVEDIATISHPTIKQYAEKCGANVLILDDPNAIHVHYRIMKCYDLLDEYDRILILDTDILISPRCPDLFKMIDRKMVGTIFEDVGSRKNDRLTRIQHAQQQWGDIGWKEHYINTGVFMVSALHKNLFAPGEYWMNLGYDDVTIGYRIHQYGFHVGELDYRFNHMSMFSEPWNDSANRFNSFIIHYAGRGVFDPVYSNKTEQMMADFNELYRGR